MGYRQQLEPCMSFSSSIIGIPELHWFLQLGLKQVDLYLIHSPRIVPPGAWQALEKIQEAGLTKFVSGP